MTYKMIKEYIEAKYGFKVHTAYIAEVKRDLGLPMYDAPNAVEELKQPRKHPTAEKVEAVKSQWSTRQLERQINSFFYERLLSSKNKEQVAAEIQTLEMAKSPVIYRRPLPIFY